MNLINYIIKDFEALLSIKTDKRNVNSFFQITSVCFDSIYFFFITKKRLTSQKCLKSEKIFISSNFKV